MTKVRYPRSASLMPVAAARLVLPTPPLPLNNKILMHSLYANGMPRFTWSKPSEQTRLGSNADRTRVAPRTARRSPDLRHIAAESFTGVADRPRSDSRGESAPGRADR